MSIFFDKPRRRNPRYDSRQLEIGTSVEMEHTSDPRVARKIAKDHLREIPDYYTRLVKMETQAQSEYDSPQGWANRRQAFGEAMRSRKNPQEINLAIGTTVPVKKLFKKFGHVFAVHRPVYRYMNSEKLSTSDKNWTVSEFSSGTQFGSSLSWGKTVSQAIANAESALDRAGKACIDEAVSKSKKIN